MATQPFHVLIIGGGSCGLALAQGLKKANISYTLYERESATEHRQRPRDWGSMFHWSQKYLERCLTEDLWARRREMYVDSGYDFSKMPGLLLWKSHTGETITHIDTPPCARISRAKMRRLLSEGLNMKYGKRLADLDYKSADGKVTAIFEDGTTATGDMLVGCDGGKSAVRRFVVGEEAAKGFDTDFTMINHHSTYPHDPQVALNLRAKHPVVSASYSPNGTLLALVAILDLPYDGEGNARPPEEWRYQINTSWKGAPRKADFNNDQAKIMTFFKERIGSIAEPFKSAGLKIDPSTPLPIDDGFNFRPMGDFEWNNHGGRVTLAGDAAHSMLPHRGQGLNNALMDSSELVDAVKKVVAGRADLKSAIDAYEAEMRPRGAEEVDRTLVQANIAASGKAADENAFAALKQSPLLKTGFYQRDDRS